MPLLSLRSSPFAIVGVGVQNLELLVFQNLSGRPGLSEGMHVALL